MTEKGGKRNWVLRPEADVGLSILPRLKIPFAQSLKADVRQLGVMEPDE